MSLTSTYQQMLGAMRQAEQQYRRDEGSVRLIAVSKTRSSDEIAALYAKGQRDFGENYLQEGLAKIALLADKGIDKNIKWHFIGAIQSKKARQIAEHFDWVHSLDRIKVAQKLNQYRTAAKPLHVLVQVNIESEQSKGGVSPKDLLPLLEAINALENLRLRGLMFMPMVHIKVDEQRAVFNAGQALFAQYKRQFPEMDQLSMGMSGDFNAAIAEGATMIRIGTALFGARSYP